MEPTEPAGYAVNALAPSTREGRRYAFRPFERWCAAEGVPALPADMSTVLIYLGETTWKTVATARSHVAAIKGAHIQANLPNPTGHPLIEGALATLARELGVASHPKTAIDDTGLARILEEDPVPEVVAATRVVVAIAAQTKVRFRHVLGAPPTALRLEISTDTLHVDLPAMGARQWKLAAAQTSVQLSALPEDLRGWLSNPGAVDAVSALTATLSTRNAALRLRQRTIDAAGRCGLLVPPGSLDTGWLSGLPDADLVELLAYLELGRDRRLRDTAFGAAAFAGYSRQCELATARWEQLSLTAERVVLRDCWSPKDLAHYDIVINHGHLLESGLCTPACLACAVIRWLEVHPDPREGALVFPSIRGGQALAAPMSRQHRARRVRKLTAGAGLEGDHATHSFRRGRATTDYRAGASLEKIADAGRWARLSTAAGYVERAGDFDTVPRLQV